MARAITLLLAFLPLTSCGFFWSVDEWTWTDGSQPPGQRLGWQNPASDESFSFEGAESACRDLRWDGLTGWRVPTFDELVSLWTPAHQGCNWKKGLYGECSSFWAVDENGTKYVVPFNTDQAPVREPYIPGHGGDNHSVRCVRDPASGADASTDDDAVETIDSPDAPPDLHEMDPVPERDGPEELEDPDIEEVPPGPVWVSIPGGSYEMGCSPGDGSCESYENPRHTVTVVTFAMTETEITQGEYLAVTGSNPSQFSSCGASCPVERVDWNQAKAYCEAIGGRLPSEAEWEYAARAGTTTPWTCVDATSSCLGGIAWYCLNSGGTTHPVKGKTPNAFGLYDMLGNVWEWVEDCWHDSYTGAPSTGGVWSGGDCSNRVLRGGSWEDVVIVVEDLRVSHRGWSISPGTWAYHVGFRCAR